MGFSGRVIEMGMGKDGTWENDGNSFETRKRMSGTDTFSVFWLFIAYELNCIGLVS